MKTIADVIEACPNCKGKGKVLITHVHSCNGKDLLMGCPICAGTGKNKQVKK